MKPVDEISGRRLFTFSHWGDLVTRNYEKLLFGGLLSLAECNARSCSQLLSPNHYLVQMF